MYKNFHLSQQVVIRNKENNILILQNLDGYWLLPGGRVDEGEETLFEALAREIKEETNFVLREIGSPIWYELSPNKNVLAIAFECTVENIDSFQISPEHQRYQWIPLSQAKDMLFYKVIGEKISALS